MSAYSSLSLYGNITYTELSHANLSNANLSKASLLGASLSEANLQSSIIIGALYEDNSVECKDADFNGAIIDDEKLSHLLSEGNAKNVPAAAKNKKELRNKLEEKGGMSADIIDILLSLYSSLQE